MNVSQLPLSPCIVRGDLLFLSGQLGFTAPGVLIEGGVDAQTTQAMQNLQSVLTAHGASMSDIVKTTVWLTDKAHFPAFNAAYARFFEAGAFPARSTVVSGLLIDGAQVEIDAIAVRR